MPILKDECHHIPAFTFEQVLKQAKAKYIVGLTTTPIRKDGHHPIIVMQCGSIRFMESAKKQAAARPFEHVVITRHTNFRMTVESDEVKIQDLCAALVLDRDRNELIFNDLLKALEMGRSPLPTSCTCLGEISISLFANGDLSKHDADLLVMTPAS